MTDMLHSCFTKAEISGITCTVVLKVLGLKKWFVLGALCMCVCVCTLCVLAPPTGQLLHKLPRMKHEYNTECKVQTLDNRWVVSIQAGSPGFSFRPPECDWGKKNLKSQVKRCFSLSSNVCCFYTIIYFTLSRKWESADEAQHDAVVLKGGFLEFLSQDGGAGLNKPMWLLRVCSQVDPPFATRHQLHFCSLFFQSARCVVIVFDL